MKITTLNLIGLLLLPYIALASNAPPEKTPGQYLVSVQLFLDEKLVASPRIVINEGQKGEITDRNSVTGDGTFLEVIAKPSPSGTPNQVFVEMVIGRFQKGSRIVLGTPQLLALHGEEASMEVGEGGKQVYKVSVKTSRPE